MDYAELREWESYFTYEPTSADRAETQMAILMQMVSAFVMKEPGKVHDFMVCPLKRAPKEKKTNFARLKEKALSLFGGQKA